MALTNAGFESKKSLLRKYVGGKLVPLQEGLLEGRASSRADAARLRRAIGRPAGSMPDVWDITLGGMPAELLGSGDRPSYAEESAHISIAMYAIHQQSRSTGMHQTGWGLGRSIFALMSADSGADFEASPVIRRFNAVATAGSMKELTTHLRGLITQLRAKEIPLDYVRLTGDLYDFNFPDSRDRIRLQWGRDLYAGQGRTKPKGDAQPQENKSNRNEF